MADALYRLICTPTAVAGAPQEWMTVLLEEGELALVPDGGGLEAITAAARKLDLASVRLLRAEEDAATQEATVMVHTGSMPAVWIAPAFGEPARKWAHDRGPMTLLVEADGAVSDEDRHRIERFVAILGRQAE